MSRDNVEMDEIENKGVDDVIEIDAINVIDTDTSETVPVNVD